MQVTTAQTVHADAVLLQDERAAWTEYLDTTRHHGYRYGEVEPWAWARLQQRLTAIAGRRLAIGRAQS